MQLSVKLATPVGVLHIVNRVMKLSTMWCAGLLGENKGINFPRHIIEDLPAVSDKDQEDIALAIEQDVDFVSVSCIRNIHDVEAVRYVSLEPALYLMENH